MSARYRLGDLQFDQDIGGALRAFPIAFTAHLCLGARTHPTEPHEHNAFPRRAIAHGPCLDRYPGNPLRIMEPGTDLR